MEYSVIALSCNKLACTRRCLSAVLRDTQADFPWELIVVDNGSSDGSAEWLTNELPELGVEFGIPVHPILQPTNQGCSPARNHGIAAAKGKLLVFIDNDIMPRTRNWLPAMANVLKENDKIGMVGPKLLYPFAPYNIQCAGVGISKNGRVCFQGRGQPQETPNFNRQQEVQCLISACLMIPAHLIQTYGSYDEAFHPVQFEDFDLCYRLREKGWLAVYTPSVSMYHFESVTTQGSPAIHNPAVVVRNGLLFKKRWHHMFELEFGPPDADCQWQNIPLPLFDSIPDPPTF